MNCCSFFGIKLVKGSSPVAVRQTKTSNNDLMVSFWGQEKTYNAYVSHMFKAFGDIAEKIQNMNLEEGMRVNIVAQAEKYDKEGKYSFKITSIDYADPKTKVQHVQSSAAGQSPKTIDLSAKDPFSQLLPEDINLI